jgi:hypothetical protein
MSRHENSKIALSACQQPRLIERQTLLLRLVIFEKAKCARTIKYLVDASETLWLTKVTKFFPARASHRKHEAAIISHSSLLNANRRPKTILAA